MRHPRELDFLHRLSGDVARAASLEEICETALQATLEALGTARAALLLYDAGGVGRHEAWRGLSDACLQALAEYAPWARDDPEARPVAIADAGEDASLEPYREVVLGEGIGAMAFVPLICDGRVLGRIAACFDAPRAPSETDLRLVETVANHVAIAIARKRADLERERLLGQMEAVFHRMPLGVAIAEAPSGRLLRYNEQAVQIFDSLLASVDCIENYARCRGYHADGTAYRGDEWPLARAITTGEVVRDEEIAYDRRDGRRGTLSVSAAPVRDEEGRILSGVAIFEDVTERRQVEESTRFLAEARRILAESLDYEATLNNVAGLLVPGLADWCVIDLLGDDGTLQLVSIVNPDPDGIRAVQELRRRYPPRPGQRHPIHAAAERRTPVLVSEVTDAYLRSLAQDETHLELLRNLRVHSVLVVPLVARGRALGALTLAGGHGRRFTEADVLSVEEVAHSCAIAVDNARLYDAARRELGERWKVEERLRELNETLENRVAARTSELGSVNEQLRDEISVRRHAERILERTNAALTRSNRELQDFAYIASHDLQEPLRKIRAFGDLLRFEYEDAVDETGRQYIERMREAALRMSELIRDLLAFSRVKARGHPFEPVRLDEVVRDAMSDLALQIRDTGARIDVDPLPVVEADAAQMRQLFQHLVANALKFSRPGVPPEVSIRVVPEPPELPPELRHCEACLIEVQDNGIGFDEKYLDRIFAPFQRLHGRGIYPGTGMGLAICRRIVERHHGVITARSAVDRGSTFCVTLPFAQKSFSDDADAEV